MLQRLYYTVCSHIACNKELVRKKKKKDCNSAGDEDERSRIQMQAEAPTKSHAASICRLVIVSHGTNSAVITNRTEKQLERVVVALQKKLKRPPRSPAKGDVRRGGSDGVSG